MYAPISSIAHLKKEKGTATTGGAIPFLKHCS
jgi:hypothetical protein